MPTCRCQPLAGPVSRIGWTCLSCAGAPGAPRRTRGEFPLQYRRTLNFSLNKDSISSAFAYFRVLTELSEQCCTLGTQGRLLAHHDQLLSDIWASLQTLKASVTGLLTLGQIEHALPHPPVEALRAAPPAVATAPRVPKVPIPERYSGEAGTCYSFLVQCLMVFDLQPLTYWLELRRASGGVHPGTRRGTQG